MKKSIIVVLAVVLIVVLVSYIGQTGATGNTENPGTNAGEIPSNATILLNENFDSYAVGVTPNIFWSFLTRYKCNNTINAVKWKGKKVKHE